LPAWKRIIGERETWSKEGEVTAVVVVSAIAKRAQSDIMVDTGVMRIATLLLFTSSNILKQLTRQDLTETIKSTALIGKSMTIFSHQIWSHLRYQAVDVEWTRLKAV
jgi:endonuclease III